MSEIVNYEEEYARSLDTFTDPGNYAQFDLTRDFRLVVGCIDPRPEERARMKVAVQTPGGGIGHAHDAALALTVENGEVATMADGFKTYHGFRVTTEVTDVHHKCAFNANLRLVLGEEAEPSDFTKASVARWSQEYGSHGALGRFLGQVSSAAAYMRDSVREGEDENILYIADGLYPNHPNLTSMRGDNQARFYVVNHHPRVGLDRNRIHTGEDPVVVQAYHSSLGASMAEIANLSVGGDSKERRGLLAAAVLMRSAATRTLLGTAHGDTGYIEVFPSTNETGLEFRQMSADVPAVNWNIGRSLDEEMRLYAASIDRHDHDM